MSEDEGVRGIPAPLPPGERILWQGGPDPRVLARSAFRAKWLGLYFATLALAGLAGGALGGAAITLLLGGVCLGLVHLFTWATARSAVYTLTDKRVIMHIGVAMPMSFNLPLCRIAAADYRALDGHHGDIALSLQGGRIAYFLLWPHARGWHFRSPQPTLRAVPDAEAVAVLLFRARQQLGPVAPAAKTEPAPARAPVGVAA
jgi:hypothetical protein